MINIEDVTLSKLALVSYMFDNLTQYNNSFQGLMEKVNGRPNLLNESHRKALIEWLNAWGCRHLSIDQHDVTSERIKIWYTNFIPQLKSIDNPIWNLSEKETVTASQIYETLKNETAGERIRKEVKQIPHIGPTASSKILFVLKPETLMPWDEAMRKKLKYKGDAESYRKYLQEIKALSLHIARLCEEKRFSIKELPEKIRRSEDTVISILNAYIWLTVTRNINLPSKDVFVEWASLLL